MKTVNRGFRRLRLMLLVVAAVWRMGAVLEAQNLAGGLSEETRRELQYAQALTEMGLPDYAEIVYTRIDDPQASGWIRVIALQGLIAQGRFDEVKAIIAREPDQDSQDTWAMKLALGDGFYAWGRYGEAQGIYESLFRAYPDGPPEAINDFYMNSAYKYAQMLILMGERRQALAAYDRVLKAKVETHVRRQVLGEKAELMLQIADSARGEERDKLLAEVEQICNDLLWVQDLWFGKAIVLLAHTRMLQGNVDGASRLIEDYRPQLRAIDEVLRQQAKETGEPLAKLSPMAQCRYLLGSMMHDQAKALLESGGDRERVVELLAGKPRKDGSRGAGALQHFLNVFIGYPATPWAPQAGWRAQEVENILKSEFGARITTRVTPEQMETVKRMQFQEARSLFNQRQFEQAAESYVSVLNLFPEGDETSAAAVSELARCYIELEDELYARTAVGYLAERFSADRLVMGRAGDEILRIAQMYEARNVPERRDEVYNLFFRHFRRHARAAPMLFRFGEQRLAEGDMTGAIEYYAQIATEYTNAPLWFDAMNKMAYAYGQIEDRVSQIRTLEQYVERLEARDRPGHELINARYRLATAFKQLGGRYVASAFNRYNELIALLRDSGDAYAGDAEEGKRNRKILEGALFYRGICLALLDSPEDRIPAYRRAAINTFESLVKDFPESEFAPAALSQAGTIWTILEQPDEAQRTLRRLQEEYPESREAQNALFMLARSLLELGRRQQAARIFAQMFERGGDYTAAQILTAGNELRDLGEMELALRAYDRVLEMSDDRVRREPAMLGKGQVLLRQNRDEEAIAVFEKMLELFERTGYTPQISLGLSRAYANLGAREPNAERRFDLFNNAVASIRRARQFQDTRGAAAESDVQVGRILLMKARAEEQFGTARNALEYKREAIATYQSLILLGQFGDAEVRPHMEDAYHESIPLLLEIERWEDAFEDCNNYLRRFPRGRYVTAVRNWRGQARIRLVREGALPADVEENAGDAADEWPAE